MTRVLKNIVNGNRLATKQYKDIANVLTGQINHKVPVTSTNELIPFI